VNPPESILPLTETVAPAEQAAVAEAIRGASESGTPVYPIGGGTSLHYGARPTRPGLGLLLTGLNRVVDYPARDLTITVEAGATIAELTARLASEQQRLPVDIAQADRATVGGVVATNPSGPRRLLWGTIRDYVLGLQAVDGSGTPFSAGGRVVKNAAGYNLCRLLTGSLGTLGVITQVTLMVKPMPETSALVACDLDDFETAEKLLAEMVRTETVPAAIELLLGPAWQGFGKGDGTLFPKGPEGCSAEKSPVPFSEPGASDSGAGRLLVGFEGTTAEVEWMIERMEAQWRSSSVSPVAIRDDAAARAWDRLTQFPAEAAPDEGEAPPVVQVSLLPSATVDFVRRLREIDAGSSVQVHAGDGVLRARLSCEPGEVAAVLRERVRPAVAEAGGSMVVLSWPGGAGLGPADVWGPAPDGLAAMRSIKNQFDRQGILNPDRFVY